MTAEREAVKKLVNIEPFPCCVHYWPPEGEWWNDYPDLGEQVIRVTNAVCLHAKHRYSWEPALELAGTIRPSPRIVLYDTPFHHVENPDSARLGVNLPAELDRLLEAIALLQHLAGRSISVIYIDCEVFDLRGASAELQDTTSALYAMIDSTIRGAAVGAAVWWHGAPNKRRGTGYRSHHLEAVCPACYDPLRPVNQLYRLCSYVRLAREVWPERRILDIVPCVSLGAGLADGSKFSKDLLVPARFYEEFGQILAQQREDWRITNLGAYPTPDLAMTPGWVDGLIALRKGWAEGAGKG